jgi:hypothetical protein
LQSNIKFIFILFLLLLLIIITFMIGDFNIEFINYSGTELINYSGTESINSLEMESIHSATGFIPCGRCPTCEAAGREV